VFGSIMTIFIEALKDHYKHARLPSLNRPSCQMCCNSSQTPRPLVESLFSSAT